MQSLDGPMEKLFHLSLPLSAENFHYQTEGTKLLHANLDSHLGTIFNSSIAIMT